MDPTALRPDLYAKLWQHLCDKEVIQMDNDLNHHQRISTADAKRTSSPEPGITTWGLQRAGLEAGLSQGLEGPGQGC
jgi:hypothetical protein